MNITKINEYNGKIPTLIKGFMSGLGDGHKLAVFVMLLESEGASESAIRDEFDLSRTSLRSTLNSLVSAGIIHKTVSRPCDLGDSKKYIYVPTENSKMMLMRLLDAYYGAKT